MGFVDLFRRDNSRDSEIKTISSLDKWMGQVPLLNFSKSAVLINDSLSRLSNSSFEGQALLDRLVIYYAPIKQLSDLAYKQFTEEMSVSLTTRRAGLFFMREMHLNYAQLFYDLVFSPKNKLNKQSMQKAAVYAHASYAYALLRSYQMVSFTPKGMWLKIYKLYETLQRDSKVSMGNISVKGGFPLGIWPLSAFYITVLLSTTNPNQSEAFELEEVFHFISENANESMFMSYNTDSAQFCLSLSKDKPPELKCHFNPKERADLYIDISYLYQVLATAKQVLSLGLEKKLTKIWDFRGEKRLERTKEQGVVDVVEGLTTIHHVLSGAKASDTKPKVSSLTNDTEEVESEQRAILEFYHTYFKQEEMTEQTAEQTNGQFIQWQLSNISQNGACLINPSIDPLNRLSVGELLSIRGIEKDTLVTAVLRWLSLREGRGVLMGLEYIAKDNLPVFVQNEAQRKNGFQYKALLVKHTYSNWPENMLITPILSYHSQEKVFLTFGENGEKEVVLTECVERTSNAIFFDVKL